MIFLALIPLFFLPFTQDYFDTNKWTLVVVAASALLLWRSWTLAFTTRITLRLNRVTLGLAAMTLASFISLLFASTNRIEALIHPFGPATFAALTLVSLLGNPTKRFLWVLFGTTSVLALIALYNPIWSPTGSSLATATLCIIVLPLLVTGIREAHTHKHEGMLALLILMTIVISAGVSMTLWKLIPKLPEVMLAPKEGWAVMLEILKNPKQALFGVGAENFLTAFTAGRPLRLNLSPLWATRFTSNANVLFHLTTIYGLMGLAALLLFSRSFFVKTARHGLSISLFLGLAALLFTPPNFTVLVVCVGLLMIATPQAKEKTITLPTWLARTMLVLVAFIGILILYGLFRFYSAEVYLSKSIAASQKNDGTTTYNMQVKAIQSNPKVSRFHIINSQTSLALSLALAKNQTEPGENRDLMTQLIQQSIREGRIAVSLNPSNILAWEHLARTYKQLIGVAQGADTWAVTTYTQAMQLDPYNPVLPVELGGVHVQMKNFTDAITQFIRATNLKPDYANAWYNLAHVYGLIGDGQNRLKALEKTKAIVDPASDDYLTIVEELEASSTPAATLVPPVEIDP